MNQFGGFARKVAASLLLELIALYRLFISPLLGANCRHLPTCSQYAKDAVITHGPLHGSYYALKRILRCHPLAEPRFDPVPPFLNRPKALENINAKNQRLGE
ncbi:membrane protein insertion efficiency factor YidD [Alphaproteobacteria bacterium]|nr:membrane protein insertion efficiency factor YidD [Alphaproteobacteria bacterium]